MHIFAKRGTIFDERGVAKRISEIEKLMMVSGFWNDRKKAGKLSQELQQKKYIIEKYELLHRELGGLDEIWMMIEQSSDCGFSCEELCVSLRKLAKNIAEYRALLFLDGKHDSCDVIFTIHAGTGGKDAQDFAQMLMRMYLRFFEHQKFKVNILDKSEGEEVGLKSAVLEVRGDMVYGLLKSEHGVHRLVRLSPFNAKHSRETSFARVEILPVVDDEGVVVDDKDLRLDTFRASGKGGQGVNTTDSAVRITHIPTGTVVQCQNERSQLQNKQAAMKVLLSRLNELKEEQKAETIDEIKGKKKEISWGNQIRSYVLQPYTMVKDHRTGEETANVQKVLDGDLERFVQAFLLKGGQ